MFANVVNRGESNGDRSGGMELFVRHRPDHIDLNEPDNLLHAEDYKKQEYQFLPNTNQTEYENNL
jgi:hypothetical protein